MATKPTEDTPKEELIEQTENKPVEKNESTEEHTEQSTNVNTENDTSLSFAEKELEEQNDNKSYVTSHPTLSESNVLDDDDNANLFVNYLPARAGDESLYALFSVYGEIESCKVMLDLQTGQSRCFGFVKYVSPQSAKTAISVLNGYKIDNKSLVVKYANSTTVTIPKGTPSNNLYIKGIPLAIEEEYLVQIFSAHGQVVDVKILYDQNTGVSKGVGFIKYNTITEAEQAIRALNGVQISGYVGTLIVRYADTTVEKQFRTRRPSPRIVSPYARPPSNPIPNSPPTYYQPPAYYPPQNTGGYYAPIPNNTYPVYETTPILERNLFIYHLPQDSDDTLLYRLFSPFGAIESAKAVLDNMGKCKGFGFVKMVNHPDAVRAIQMMNGAQVGNKYLKVSFKK